MRLDGVAQVVRITAVRRAAAREISCRVYLNYTSVRGIEDLRVTAAEGEKEGRKNNDNNNNNKNNNDKQ